MAKCTLLAKVTVCVCVWQRFLNVSLFFSRCRFAHVQGAVEWDHHINSIYYTIYGRQVFSLLPSWNGLSPLFLYLILFRFRLNAREGCEASRLTVCWNSRYISSEKCADKLRGKRNSCRKCRAMKIALVSVSLSSPSLSLPAPFVRVCTKCETVSPQDKWLYLWNENSQTTTSDWIDVMSRRSDNKMAA